MADNTHETKIVISGDDSGAIGLLSSVRKHLDGVFHAVGSLTRYLSRLNWAISAVHAVIEGVRKLHEWANRAETAAKALREELTKASYDNAVATVEGPIDALKSAHPEDYAPAGYTYDTSTLSPNGNGFGKLTVNCVVFYRVVERITSSRPCPGHRRGRRSHRGRTYA